MSNRECDDSVTPRVGEKQKNTTTIDHRDVFLMSEIDH
jgi:hypothetical protein